MTTKTRSRQPAGVPVGGQYAGETTSSTGLTLVEVATCRRCGAPTDTAGDCVVHLGEDGAVDHAADSDHLPVVDELARPSGEVRVEAELNASHRSLVDGLTGSGTSGTVTSATTTPDGRSIVELDLEGTGELVVSRVAEGTGSRVEVAVRVGQSIGRQGFTSTFVGAAPDETHLRLAGLRAALSDNLRRRGVTGPLDTEVYLGSRGTLVLIEHGDRRLTLSRRRGEQSFSVGSGRIGESSYSHATGPEDLGRLLGREISAQEAPAVADELFNEALEHPTMKRLSGWGF